MVGWYNPPQLIRTGTELIISDLFARHSDSRRLDAVATDPPMVDYRDSKYLDEDGSFGFDFVADTGDGWNSTYAVASALSKPGIALSDDSTLKRGKVLVLGGDLVNPYPTREAYDARFVGPFTMAGQQHRSESLEVLAIPGNHDWYDSLVGFRRLFCNGRTVGHRRTRQTRSYFAAQLPYDWWLFGIDSQLDHDVDELQFRFFQDIIANFRDNDRVMMVVHEPVWIIRAEMRDPRFPTRLENLEELIGDRLRLYVAGHLHHYRRHSNAKGQHRITCGTGGSFLHPTHELSSDSIEEYELKNSFPSKEQSWRSTLRNLWFVKRNPAFGIVTGLSYLLAAWQNGIHVGEQFGEVSLKEMGRLGLSEWAESVYAGVHSAVLNPIGLTLYGVIFAGFVFFADKRSAWFRYIVGTAHAFCHVVAGFLIYWFAAYASITWAAFPAKSIEQYLLAGAIIVCLGWIAGSSILGIYLIVSLNVFKMHWNEAFSALRIQDWKGFLRFRIAPTGALRMSFVGLRKVPRRWVFDSTATTYEPEHPEKFKPEELDRVEVGAALNRGS
jgi:hypothetical protein